MKKSLRFSKGILTLAIFTMLGASCSTPQYYVYKTVKNHPHVKQETQTNDTQKDLTAEEVQPKETPVAVKEVMVEEVAIASTAPSKTVTETVSLRKAEQIIAEKAAPQNQEKITKIEQLKTAIKVKKEIRKMKKSLDENKDINQESDSLAGSKNQLVALLLGIFLGGFGIHRFYLGYTWQGILQIVLLLTTFLILPGIALLVWVLVDIIRIAMGTLGPKDGSGYDPEL